MASVRGVLVPVASVLAASVLEAHVSGPPVEVESVHVAALAVVLILFLVLVLPVVAVVAVAVVGAVAVVAVVVVAYGCRKSCSVAEYGSHLLLYPHLEASCNLEPRKSAPRCRR